MKKLFKVVAGLFPWLSLLASPTTIPLYINIGVSTNSPQIDAVAFANWGTFSPIISLGLPYDFQNTRFFTNQGVMGGLPGFRFDFVDDFGVRRPAENFFNDTGASIQAAELSPIPAMLRVNSTNVFSRGDIIADVTGVIELRGQNVDIARSSIQITPLLSGGGFQDNGPPFLYSPDVGVFDQWWGLGENDPRVASSRLVTVFRGAISGSAPPHCVTNFNPGLCNSLSFSMDNPASFVYTNAVTPTNWIIQVMLVGLQDTNINPSVALYRSSNPTNFFRTATVQLASYFTNVATVGQDLVTLYLIDRLASETNFTVITNINTGDVPYRPAPYEFTRDLPFEFALGQPTNAWERTNLNQLIYNTGGLSITNVTTNYFEIPQPPTSTNSGVEFVTNIVSTLGYAYDVITNIYASWGGFVTNVSFVQPSVPGSSITNAEGRVEIWSDNLNMERTRIRGESHVSINTKHLISSSRAAVDVGSLFYNLGSTNGTLQLQSLTLPEVRRMAGDVWSWSGVWTNQFLVITNSITNTITTNITIDPANPGPPMITVTNDPGTNTIVTNFIEVGIHLMLMDADQLQTTYPTFVNGLEAHSTNVFVNDTMRVLEGLLIDAQALTINTNGKLLLGDLGNPINKINDWNAQYFPNLRYLTNLGIISAPNVGDFGSDRTNGYASFLNRGTNVASALRFKVDELENAGAIATAQLFVFQGQIFLFPQPGRIDIEANRVKLEGGTMTAGNDIQIAANEVKLRNTTNTTSKALRLFVSQNLADSGPGANCLFVCGHGIHLMTKPANGSLLGTKVDISSARFEANDSTWAGADLGATKDGYVNNAALGWLRLNPGIDGQLIFSGTEAHNGLYVDYLEIGPSAANALTDSIVINPNLTIYFAAASLPTDTLTNAFPGRLVWVPDFAGPNSSVDVVVTIDPNTEPPVQKTITVNRGLRESPTVDSDGDGIGNGFDLDPFGGVRILGVTLSAPPQQQAQIAWSAAANTVYRVDYATHLGPSDWTLLTTYTNDVPATVRVTVTDPTPVGSTPRYYRVSYAP